MRRLFLIAAAFVYIVPLLIIFTNSFMSPAEIARNFGDTFDYFDYQHIGEINYVDYRLVPEIISFRQYFVLLFQTPVYLQYFVNSLLIALPITAIQIFVGALAAYGFTVWKSRFCETLFRAYIIVMVLPFQATLVPNFIMADTLGILNTRAAVILPLGFAPFAVFIMRQSMKGIPRAVFEAAQTDGANHIQRFFYIALPMSKSGAASLVILTLADSWALVEHPMIFLRDAALEPLSVTLYKIANDNIGLIFAASVFYMIPLIWVFLYGQEYLEQGVKLSALR